MWDEHVHILLYSMLQDISPLTTGLIPTTLYYWELLHKYAYSIISYALGVLLDIFKLSFLPLKLIIVHHLAYVVFLIAERLSQMCVRVV